MKIVKLSEVSREPFDNPIFTGPQVTRQVLVPSSRDYEVNVVNFGQGVRNKFHAHDCDQVLIVTAGKGVVATEDEERVVGEGDVILIPAGEKHWHGATEASEFSHIYVIKAGSEVTRFEDQD